MAFSSVFVVLFFLSTSILAQGLSGIPSCAATCANNAVFLSSCNGTDVHCLCSSNTVVRSISCCIITSCTDADRQATLQYFDGFCQSAGVTLPDESGPCPSAAPSNSTQSNNASSHNSSKSSGSFSKAAIIAISTIAAVLIICIAAILLLLFRRKAQKRIFQTRLAELSDIRASQYHNPAKHEMETREAPPSSQGGYDPNIYYLGRPGLPGRADSPQTQLYPHELYGQNLSPAPPPQSPPRPQNTMFSFQSSPTELHRASPKSVGEVPVQIQYPVPRRAVSQGQAQRI